MRAAILLGFVLVLGCQAQNPNNGQAQNSTPGPSQSSNTGQTQNITIADAALKNIKNYPDKKLGRAILDLSQDKFVLVNSAFLRALMKNPALIPKAFGNNHKVSRAFRAALGILSENGVRTAIKAASPGAFRNVASKNPSQLSKATILSLIPKLKPSDQAAIYRGLPQKNQILFDRVLTSKLTGALTKRKPPSEQQVEIGLLTLKQQEAIANYKKDKKGKSRKKIYFY